MAYLEKMSDNKISLLSIYVEGLFGHAPLLVELDPQRPTVLTGANGTGKSTLLGLVNAVASANAAILATAPFQRLTLRFQGLADLDFVRASPNEVIVAAEGREGLIATSPHIKELPSWALQILEDCGYEAALALKEVSTIASNSGITFEEYREVRSAFERIAEDPRPFVTPAWFSEMMLAFPVLFVTDQRLVAEGSRPKRRGPGNIRSSRLAVDAASADLAEQLQNADSNYARASQQRDRRFPQELIASMESRGDVSVGQLADLIHEVDVRREALKQVGLLDEDDNYEPSLSAGQLEAPEIRTVIGAVFEATKAKLAVLDSLELRLSAFKEFLDERFFPKFLILSRSDGMRFGSPDAPAIRPRQLSSGEQQMVVLAYEILFRAEPGTLVIIDEPEISLHVLWQDTLIDDLTRMARASNLSFLMATHSPIILAGHGDLERALGTRK